MTNLRSGILTLSIIILSIIIIMITPSINIEKSGIGIKNHSAYSSSSSSSSSSNPVTTSAGINLADFNFAAAGDWGCTSDTTNTLKNIIAHDPEFVLALGDLSYEDSAKCWLDIISPIANKTMIAIGNHDTESPTKLKEYMDFFGLKGQYYSFNFQNVHFIVMSTELPYEEGSAQYNFVNNDLSKVSLNPDIDWIIVDYHSLAYTSPANIGKGNSAEKELRDTYHPLFVKYNVDLVLQAHNHNYQRSYPIIYNNDNSTNPIITDTNKNNYYDPKGMVFGTIGTAGAEIYPLTGQAPYIATQYVGFGFFNVDVINDGTTLTAKFIANNGTIKDQFTITK
ncbi:MAG TPA: metallophosphoesterase [Nitrososphaeraceae archaeon]|nr:metallophosphoesterase [Nitrososphaeraceae archaeon]